MWRDGTVSDPGFQARESAKGLHTSAQRHDEVCTLSTGRVRGCGWQDG